MIRLAIAGATGRTGRCVVERALGDERFEVVAALERPGSPANGSIMHCGEGRITVADTLEAECDVLIDFMVAEGTMSWLEICTRMGVAMVIGTTGHSERQMARIMEAARVIPILKATNFSVGIQAVLRIVGELAARLGEAYDTEIIEAHHRYKVDAPSGTALSLADEVAVAKGLDSGKCVVFGREGQVGERPAGQIGVHAVRMGDVIGWHEVHFSGPGETVTIRHAANSRDTFAAGALRGAVWIADMPPGLYGMGDVLR